MTTKMMLILITGMMLKNLTMIDVKKRNMKADLLQYLPSASRNSTATGKSTNATGKKSANSANKGKSTNAKK